MVSAQQEQRKVKSEHNSPLLGYTSNLNQLNGQLPPLDLSNLEGFTDWNFPFSFDGLPTMPEVEQPIFSAGLSAASVDWSHYDGLDFNNDNFATSEFSQAPSFTGFDFTSIDQPALTTTSTSGEISEVEDFGSYNDPVRVRPNLVTQQYGSDFDTSDLGENEGYRLSTASSYMGMPQAQMLTNNEIGSLNIDDFLKGLATSNPSIPSVAATTQTTFGGDTKFMPNAPFDESAFQIPQADEDDALWMNEFASNSSPLDNGSSEISENNRWAQ